MMSQRAARKSSWTTSDPKAKKAVDGPLIAMVRVSSAPDEHIAESDVPKIE
jgi:hypothetical protein